MKWFALVTAWVVAGLTTVSAAEEERRKATREVVDLYGSKIRAAAVWLMPEEADRGEERRKELAGALLTSKAAKGAVLAIHPMNAKGRPALVVLVPSERLADLEAMAKELPFRITLEVGSPRVFMESAVKEADRENRRLRLAGLRKERGQLLEMGLDTTHVGIRAMDRLILEMEKELADEESRKPGPIQFDGAK